MLYDYFPGSIPLLISIPHAGTVLPDDIARRLTPGARAMPDTDWFVPELYAFAEQLGAYRIQARTSRMVVDLNRPPDNRSLYPGQATTGVCPDKLFDGSPAYLDNHEPDETEIAQRIDTYWRPYHSQLASALDEIRALFGYAILYDAHSIRSRVARLFDGRLPDLNLGTANGESCGPHFQQSATKRLDRQDNYSFIVNGRFVGGYITRHYGSPAENVHALQMEIAQCAYMEEVAAQRDPAREQALAVLLETLLRDLIGTGAEFHA